MSSYKIFAFGQIVQNGTSKGSLNLQIGEEKARFKHSNLVLEQLVNSQDGAVVHVSIPYLN